MRKSKKDWTIKRTDNNTLISRSDNSDLLKAEVQERFYNDLLKEYTSELKSPSSSIPSKILLNSRKLREALIATRRCDHVALNGFVLCVDIYLTSVKRGCAIVSKGNMENDGRVFYTLIEYFYFEVALGSAGVDNEGTLKDARWSQYLELYFLFLLNRCILGQLSFAAVIEFAIKLKVLNSPHNLQPCWALLKCYLRNDHVKFYVHLSKFEGRYLLEDSLTQIRSKQLGNYKKSYMKLEISVLKKFMGFASDSETESFATEHGITVEDGTAVFKQMKKT
ncbi:hypothetical protein MP638_005381 [Amoeboaphelidium occidentale]|nr:hypothetical protein MP638_005381 [Amoeboaphelidium occidentale]